MDLFWMPVAEPAGLSSGWETRGKVNLNYRMVPFSHIDRATALHSVLKSERLLAVPTSAGPVYKIGSEWHEGWHRRIDADETLEQWEAKFDAGEVFVSATELCEQWLYPEGIEHDGAGDGMRAFWEEHRLSGDNVLERPYANIYPRVCTRSNVYRVHVRVEAIAKAAGSAPGRFVPGEDQVGEAAQGSVLLRRRLDPGRDDLPGWKGDLGQATPPMDYFYEWQVGPWED